MIMNMSVEHYKLNLPRSLLFLLNPKLMCLDPQKKISLCFLAYFTLTKLPLFNIKEKKYSGLGLVNNNF